MGDRVYCTLSVGGVTTLAQWETFIDILNENLPWDDRDDTSLFGFEEINYGALHEKVAEKLKQLKLSYTWEWGTGGGYSSGIYLYNAKTSEGRSYVTVEDEIALTVRQIDENSLKEATKWVEFVVGHLTVLDAPSEDLIP